MYDPPGFRGGVDALLGGVCSAYEKIHKNKTRVLGHLYFNMPLENCLHSNATVLTGEADFKAIGDREQAL